MYEFFVKLPMLMIINLEASMIYFAFLPRDAMGSHVVRLRVCLSVCDVGGSGPHR